MLTAIMTEVMMIVSVTGRPKGAHAEEDPGTGEVAVSTGGMDENSEFVKQSPFYRALTNLCGFKS